MKKAFMKTVEAVLAVLLTSVVLIMLISRQELIIQENQAFLPLMEKDPSFRELALTEKCYNSSESSVPERYLPSERDYLLCIGVVPDSFPKTEVIGETLFFAGNFTDSGIKVVRLYHWLR